MTIWEKVSNIIKTNFKSKLRYLKAEKRFNKKENFQCFYVLVILFDLIYRNIMQIRIVVDHTQIILIGFKNKNQQ